MAAHRLRTQNKGHPSASAGRGEAVAGQHDPRAFEDNAEDETVISGVQNVDGLRIFVDSLSEYLGKESILTHKHRELSLYGAVVDVFLGYLVRLAIVSTAEKEVEWQILIIAPS